MSIAAVSTGREGKVRLALLWMRLADEPVCILLTLLSFLMRKDLGASALQISLLATIRPVISVFSFYWGANLMRRRSKLLSNLMGAWAFGRLPMLFVPLVQNVWYLIFCVAVYQFFYRAGTPALVEILKLTMGRDRRDKLFSLAMVLSFAEGILFGIVLSYLFGASPFIWKALFGFAALLSVSSIFMQRRIDLPPVEDAPVAKRTNKLVQPWIDSFKLLRRRPDFARFQIGFMFGGFGLMMMFTPLTIFYADVLGATKSQYTMARSIYMGIGVALSTFLWRRALSAISTHRMTALILGVFALFPLVVLFAPFYFPLLFAAFLIYGIGQSGSQLLWNLSGTYFAGDEESSQYTTVNVLTVGIRGLVGPLLGGLLCQQFGAVPSIIVGMMVCFMGMVYMLRSPAPARGVA